MVSHVDDDVFGNPFFFRPHLVPFQADAVIREFQKDENSGLKPEFLASKICSIVGRKNPHYRYIIASPLQKLAVAAKTLLPRRLFYRILSLYYNL